MLFGYTDVITKDVEQGLESVVTAIY